jgi:hypothetical protein
VYTSGSGEGFPQRRVLEVCELRYGVGDAIGEGEAGGGEEGREEGEKRGVAKGRQEGLSDVQIINYYYHYHCYYFEGLKFSL